MRDKRHRLSKRGGGSPYWKKRWNTHTHTQEPAAPVLFLPRVAMAHGAKRNQKDDAHIEGEEEEFFFLFFRFFDRWQLSADRREREGEEGEKSIIKGKRDENSAAVREPVRFSVITPHQPTDMSPAAQRQQLILTWSFDSTITTLFSSLLPSDG